MDNIAKEYVIDFFSRRLSVFGDTPPAVGWSAIGQRLRYEWILRLITVEKSSLLDFGCGKGDFYGYLKDKGLDVKYTGIDLNPELIKVASNNYPDAEFFTLDLDNEEISGIFDYTILCGVFNLNIDGVKESAEESLKKLYQCTGKGLVFNCLNSRCTNKDTNLFYFEPSELLSLASKLTSAVSLYDDLVDGDIFLLLSKNE